MAYSLSAESFSTIRRAVEAVEIEKLSSEKQCNALIAAAAQHGFTENVTGDVVVGDEILFLKLCFSGGSFGRYRRKPSFDGYSVEGGVVVRDSYGKQRGQHTFTICTATGEKICRKGRVIYKELVLAKPRADAERTAALEEKHRRGDESRASRRAELEAEAVRQGWTKKQAGWMSMAELRDCWRNRQR